jgi:transcriptional regulator with XRE-family HTH domain
MLSSKEPDPIDVEVGRRIRSQRNICGLTQTALGEQVAVTFQQIQKYERGMNRVGASRLKAIAFALGVTVSFFFDGVSDPRSSGSNDGHIETDVLEFLGSGEGLVLNKAFVRVRNPKVRRNVVALVVAISKISNSDEGSLS